MISLLEPLWGKKFFLAFYAVVQQSLFLYTWLPIFADIFVFVYPLFLVGLYVWGIIKKELSYRKASLYVFFATFCSAVMNVGFIQSFLSKERPNIYFDLQIQDKSETLLHKYLPSSSFPSDHATVAMAIAMATLFWGIVYKDRKYRIFGYILIIIAVIMSFSRIGVGVHWLTDILAGFCVGICIPLLLLEKKIYNFCEKNIFMPLISLQKKIIKR